jgi:uncharacterized membrane protein
MLYCYVYSLFVAVGHGVYLIASTGFRWRNPLTAYLLASLAGFLTFIPWIWVIINSPSLQKNAGGIQAAHKESLLSLSKRWAGNLSRVFLDLNLNSNTSPTDALLLIPFILIVLVLVSYSIYFICRHSPKQCGIFILTLIGASSLPIMLLDILLRSQRFSGTPRYLTASYLGIQLAVAYLLTTKITEASVVRGQRNIWRLVTVILISAGVLSCTISSQAEGWWNKGITSQDRIHIARIINKAVYPLVINDSNAAGNIMSFTYLFNPKVHLMLGENLDKPEIPTGFSDVFLFNPTKKLRDQLEQEQNSKVELVYKSDATDDLQFGTWLWRLVTVKI